MLNLCRVTKVKVLFLVLVFVFNFDLFKFSAAILEKGLLSRSVWCTFWFQNLLELNMKRQRSIPNESQKN